MSPTRIVSSRDLSTDDVKVHPRYLAGAPSSPDDAFASLSSRRWHHFSDERGNRYANDTASRLTVAFLPEASDVLFDATTVWQIRGRAAPGQKWLWTAALTEGTPPEFIGAVAKAIDRDLASGEQGQQRVLVGGDDNHPDLIWNRLREADWYITASGWHVHGTSPDGLARISYRPAGIKRRIPSDQAWRVTVSRDGHVMHALWEADFHNAVPVHLIVAFADALTDPAPLTRNSRDIPESSHAFATPRINPPKAQ